MGTTEPLFFRRATDGRILDCSFLESSCAGTSPSAVWIIGGGPSLLSMPCDLIQNSPTPKFAMNLAGRGKDGNPPLIRPDFWTCYDPTSRFHRSIFLDPSIDKFLLASRAMDLVPGGNEKLCDCPRTFFVRHKKRGYLDFIGPEHRDILDAKDSFLQAIDIAYRLGFRTFYCVGTELRVRPSAAQIEFAISKGVNFDPQTELTHFAKKQNDNQIKVQSDLLRDFIDQVKVAGEFPTFGDAVNALAKLDREQQYSFDAQKSLQAAISCDSHYWQRVQYLRLSRRNLSLNGVRIVSCTPRSRLNDWFPFMAVEEALSEIATAIPDPERETTAGRYEGKVEKPGVNLPYHRDVDPEGWERTKLLLEAQGDVGIENELAVEKPLKPQDGPRIEAMQQLEKVRQLREQQPEIQEVG